MSKMSTYQMKTGSDGAGPKASDVREKEQTFGEFFSVPVGSWSTRTPQTI